jgi:hypothetical protein
MESHPARHAAAHRRLLIQAKVHAGGGAQETVDPLHAVAFSVFSGERFLTLQQVRMAADPRQFGGDSRGRQNKINGSSRDRARGHSRPSRCFRVLRERDAAFLLDGLQAHRPVRSATGEKNAYGRGLPRTCQGGKEFVDGMVGNRGALPRNQLQSAARDDHAVIGRNHVYAVPLNHQAVGYLEDRQSGRFREKLRQSARVLGGQMLNHHDGHPRPRGHGLQKLCQGLQPSGRRAHADNRKGSTPRRFAGGDGTFRFEARVAAAGSGLLGLRRLLLRRRLLDSHRDLPPSPPVYILAALT